MDLRLGYQLIHMKIASIFFLVPFSKKLPKPITTDSNLREITLIDQDEVDDTIDVSHDEQEKFNSIIKKYQHIFSDSPGKIKQFECQIRVTPGEPICQKPYPIPMSKAIKTDK